MSQRELKALEDFNPHGRMSRIKTPRGRRFSRKSKKNSVSVRSSHKKRRVFKQSKEKNKNRLSKGRAPTRHPPSPMFIGSSGSNTQSVLSSQKKSQATKTATRSQPGDPTNKKKPFLWKGRDDIVLDEKEVNHMDHNEDFQNEISQNEDSQIEGFQHDDSQNEISQKEDFQQKDDVSQDGDSQQEDFKNEVSQKEYSQKEDFKNDVSQDEDFQDENFQDEDFQDEDSQDEDSKSEVSQDEDFQDEDSQDEDSKSEVSQDEDFQDEDSQDEDSKSDEPQDMELKLLKQERFKKGEKTLIEIMKLQRKTGLLIPKTAFQRVVKDIFDKIADEKNDGSSFRIQASALLALQEATELYIVGLFEDTNLITLNRHQVTVQTRDMKLAKHLTTKYKSTK